MWLQYDTYTLNELAYMTESNPPTLMQKLHDANTKLRQHIDGCETCHERYFEVAQEVEATMI